MNRAYSVFTVKSFDEDQRIIQGIATTPAPDLMGDIVVPEGAQFSLPLPLLWMHQSDQPIGHVTAAKVSKSGITITAKLAKIVEPGTLRDRLDEAWLSIRSGLVKGLSIGFKDLERVEIKDSYAYKFTKWLWLELSAVTVPANQEASIQLIKSLDADLRAASGQRKGAVFLDPHHRRARRHPGAIYLD